MIPEPTTADKRKAAPIPSETSRRGKLALRTSDARFALLQGNAAPDLANSAGPIPDCVLEFLPVGQKELVAQRNLQIRNQGLVFGLVVFHQAVIDPVSSA